MSHGNFGRLTRLLTTIAILSLLTACSTGKDTPVRVHKPAEKTPSVPAIADIRSPEAIDAESKGDFQAAAREYNRLAESATTPQKEEYQLLAAAVLLRGNYTEQAQRAVQTIQTNGLPPHVILRHRMLIARLAIHERRIEDAYTALSETPNKSLLTQELTKEFFQLRAEIQHQRGDGLAALRDYIAYRPLLTDLPEIYTQQSRLWNMLMAYDDPTLMRFSEQTADEVERGWLALALLSKRAELPSVQLSKEILMWRDRFPLHPATEEVIQAVLALQQDQTYRPKQIALILPESGAFAASGTAVRDGFVAAFFARSDRDYTPLIRMYDTGESVDQASRAYDMAVQDGAELIVGPLSKDSLNALASLETLPVPTVGLNYASNEGPVARNLYQFGLAPEGEAMQIAERAWLDGHNQAIALVPEGNWGARIIEAFNSRWQQLGGSVLEIQTYPANANDFSTPLQQLLSIDESRARAQALRTVIGQMPKFDPRRRKDVDFIFVAALPHQARQIRPQLKFFYAQDLNIYGTSHIFTGTIDAKRDRDMDDIVFADMPWTVQPSESGARLWSTIETQFPKSAPVYKRLYALGADSFNLIPNLRRLNAYGFQTFQGETGYLSIDEFGRLRRQLVWAKFINGVPTPIDSVSNETPNETTVNTNEIQPF